MAAVAVVMGAEARRGQGVGHFVDLEDDERREVGDDFVGRLEMYAFREAVDGRESGELVGEHCGGAGDLLFLHGSFGVRVKKSEMVSRSTSMSWSVLMATNPSQESIV